jgi:hypothetical protein
MEPKDDPEARIRELERPLTDVARTSELGTAQPGGYAPTQPLPPPMPFPDTFPTTQVRTTAGFRWGWMVLAALVVGVGALAAGVAVYTTHQFSRDGSTISFPTTFPRTGTPGSPGSGTQAPAVPSPGSRVSIAGFDKNQTIACNDSFVSVSGFSNTIVITGHCASLTVSGSQNTVTVDAADTINAAGFENRVTFHSGSPRVTKSGESNVVEQG